MCYVLKLTRVSLTNSANTCIVYWCLLRKRGRLKRRFTDAVREDERAEEVTEEEDAEEGNGTETENPLWRPLTGAAGRRRGSLSTFYFAWNGQNKIISENHCWCVFSCQMFTHVWRGHTSNNKSFSDICDNILRVSPLRGRLIRSHKVIENVQWACTGGWFVQPRLRLQKYIFWRHSEINYVDLCVRVCL